METKTIITELNQEDLVDLLCTATYGSSWLDCSAPERTGCVIDDNDSREDVWAKALLAGHKIKCFDYYAEGEVYGPHGKVIKKDGTAVYFIGLDDILKGLQSCADGTFKHDDDEYGEREVRWLKECYAHFSDPDQGRMEMDNPEAEALMQVIMFNELIYG